MNGLINVVTSPLSVDVRWEVLPEYRDILLGREGLRLTEWLQEGRAVIVKDAPHRTIYRVQLESAAFFVKHYPSKGVGGKLRRWWKSSKARGEFHKARELARRGIATFTSAAVGESRSGGCWLISLELTDASPLDSFLQAMLPTYDSAHQSRMRKQVAVALARFVSQMHAAGVCHHDFHPGNLLLRWTDNEPEFFLIDLHEVHRRASMSWSACRSNLAMLNNWFAVRASRSDRLRFWRAYCAASLRPQCAGEARRIEKESWTTIREIWRQRDGRCLAHNRYYRRIKNRRRSPSGDQMALKGRNKIAQGNALGNEAARIDSHVRAQQHPRLFWRPFAAGNSKVRGHAVAGLDDAFVRTLVGDPDEPFRRPEIRILKNSRSSSVIEFTAETGGDSRRLIYKRFNAVSIFDSCRAFFRWDKALRSWFFGQCLFDRFLPTPRPLLVLHKRSWFTQEAYLLTEKIEDACQLDEFVNTALAEGRHAELQDCLEQIARLIRDLHRHGFSHRDLKACNILVNRADGAIKVWLIDLVGVEKPRILLRRRKLQNLARLHASFHNHPSITRSHKLRFLQIYLQCGLFGSRNWKTWWRAIAKATLAKIERNRRIGRPLF